MKTLPFALWLLGASLGGFSQPPADSSGMDLLPVYHAIRQIQPTGTIYYTSQTHQLLENGIHLLRKGRTIRGRNNESPVRLTRSERHYLLRELTRLQEHFWPDHLFEDGQVISSDSVQVHIQRTTQDLAQQARMITGSDSLNAYLTKSRNKNVVFTFSPPIYLRDRSLFLQFFCWYNGSGGYNGIRFYQKEEGRWVSMLQFAEGNW